MSQLSPAAAVEVAGGADDRDQRHAGLDEPPSQQHTLTADVIAVNVADAGGFLVQIDECGWILGLPSKSAACAW